MAIEATGRATFTAVEDYDIVFVLNGIRCDVLNFDSVRAAENAVLEADFFNGGEPCVVDKAVLCCYDGEGSLLGSPIEVHDASSAVADGGSLYLSKDCKTITCDIYAGDKKLCGKGMPVIRNGSSVGVKAVSYKVINNVAANASLNWDGAQSQTTYPTQKPEKGKYCYVMTIVLYTDGTSTNTVSTSYTPNDGVNGTSVKVASTTVEYVGSDSGTTPPSSGWQTAVPQLAQGKYLWTRTTVKYSDNNSTTSYSVGRIGMDGSKGGTTHILYASSANPQSEDDVRTTIDAQHQYYGTYQDTDLNDDADKYTKVTSWVLIKGDAGKSPQPNLCRYNSLVLKTAKSLSYDLSSNTYTIVNNTPNKEYGSQVNLSPIIIPYGQRYTASADVYSPVAAAIIIDYNNSPVSGSAWGGNDNDDGGGRSSNRIEIPANTWTTITWSAINSSSANTNKVDINIWDSIGSSAPADTVWKLRNLKVEFGDTATPWVPNREDINGTQYRTVEKYAYGTSNTVAPTSGWSDSVSGGTAGQYLWNQETAQHKAATDTVWVNDGVPTTHCIGYIAKNGVDGENGANFTGVTEHYKATNDGEKAPAVDGSWKDTPTDAKWSANNPYLWNYETITRDKGGSINTNVHLGSVWGKQGIKGNDGHSPTVTIGKNGNWYIDNKDSGQKAQGNDGHTPTVTIGDDGYWYIDNVKTSQKAQGEPGAPGADAVSYRLVRMADTAATVRVSGGQYKLAYVLHYKAMRIVGGSESAIVISTIAATIEGVTNSVTPNATEGTMSGIGSKSYTATDRPVASIPVTVTLNGGTVLYDSVPVTMEAGVAIDIDNKVGSLTATVAGHTGKIITLELRSDRISAKVGALGLRNLLMDSEFRCPVERAITRNGKRYREAWNNGTSVSVTDTANGINAEGINAVKAYSPTADGDWAVTRWYVPARPGQAYTASVWRMVPDTGTLASNSRIILELHACKDDLTRDNSYQAGSAFDSPSPGTWARTAATLTMPEDTAHPYIEVALVAYKCGTVYFRQPQLEYGSEATDWTRSPEDVEGGLLATGVDIESGQITLTADNVAVRNNSGAKIALFGTTQDGTPFLNTDLIDARVITVDRLMAFNGDTMLTSINYGGHGEFVQYYADGNKKMEISDGNIIYYNDDTKNSVKWIIGENGTSETIDNWSTITLCRTDETGSNVQTVGNLSGEEFSVFNAAENSANANYSGMTVKGKQSGISPTATWLQKIPDGWYTNTGFALRIRNADGTTSAVRRLYEYSEGKIKGHPKLITFDTANILLHGGDYSVPT